jgi:hypothetical protein
MTFGLHTLAVTQFECWGRFGGVNTDDEYGYAYVVLSSVPGGLAPVEINPFDTGDTSAYGISAGVGRLQLRWDCAPTAERLRRGPIVCDSQTAGHWT